MAKKKMIFVDEEHDYDYKVKTDKFGNVKHTLYHSNGRMWTDEVRGKKILSITDNGNGLKINKKIKKSLLYHEAFELSILLKIISFNDSIVEWSNKEVI